MFDQNSTKSETVSETVGNFPNFESLADEHDRVFRKFNELYDAGDEGDECEQLNARMWALRGLINATPPKSPSEIRALARVLKNAAGLDEGFECNVPGSARKLSLLLVESVNSLEKVT
ncbi:hypothetical protein AMST5_01290 [freshwater sediment metagenome]|uniref:Uncharacterized protein n=1 Tax=freshwater sediment metagenome TaxID=556182 RepID=A0AA48M1A8_9ZZZZ